MNSDNTQDSAEPSLASAGYADGWEPNYGDTVRVKAPDQFVSSLARKVQDRDGIVVLVWTLLGYGGRCALVRFGKRAGRGKDFELSMSVGDLIPWPQKDAERLH